MSDRYVQMGARNRGPWYLAGPMTGIPHENIPLFNRVAASLRKLGYEIMSPVELDDAESTGKVLSDPTGKLVVGDITGETWGDMLARDVKLIADTLKGIILLPGWRRSRGARLEAYVAILCGHEFLECEFDEEGELSDLVGLDPEYVMREIYNAS